MAPKPDLALDFGLVLAMALVVLAITTWADHLPNPGNSVAPIPPRQTIYRAQYWKGQALRKERLRCVQVCRVSHRPGLSASQPDARAEPWQPRPVRARASGRLERARQHAGHRPALRRRTL